MFRWQPPAMAEPRRIHVGHLCSAHRVWELLREAHLAAPFRVDTVPCQPEQEVVNRKIPT